MINAADLTSTAQDPVVRVTDGFQDLISRTFTQLGLLGGSSYSEQQVAAYANPDQSGMFEDPSFSTLSVPGNEVLSFILQRDNLGEQVTVKTIVDAFQSKPYGWDLASIEVVVAWLIGTSKITLSIDGSALKRTEVAAVLRNTQKHAHAVVAQQKVFDDRKVDAFRKFCTEFFDDATPPKDPLELARHGGEKLRSKLDELKAMVTGSKYPFVEQLTAPIDLLEQAVDKSDEWYLTEFSFGDDLLDAKESVIDPIQSFLSGGQRTIHDDAVALLAENANNLSYLPSASDTEARQLLDDPNSFRGNRMAQLKQAAAQLQDQIDEAVAADRATVVKMIDARAAELVSSKDFKQAPESEQLNSVSAIDVIRDRVNREAQIAMVRQLGFTFEETTYPSLLDQLAAARSTGGSGDGAADPVKLAVSVKSINAPDVHGVLENPEDVDRYLDALRGALLSVLSDGKRITL